MARNRKQPGHNEHLMPCWKPVQAEKRGSVRHDPGELISCLLARTAGGKKR